MRTLVAILALSAATALAQAPDPAVGTWKVDNAKSKYSPGPAPKSVTVKWEAVGKGVKTTSEVVNADSSTVKAVYTAAYDGKDYPITGSAIADTVALKWDGKALKRVDKKAGKEVQRFERTVSEDGKTMTIKQQGKNAKGEDVNNVMVLQKQ